MVQGIITKNKYIILLLLISIIFSLPLFGGYYASHDGEAHLARISQYETALKDKQFPPRWAGTLNYKYGSPLLIFFYPFAGYLSSFFHIIGFSYENSFLIIAFISSLIGSLSFYAWSNKMYSGNISFISSIFYTFLPYRFLTLYVRGSIGEFLSFSIVPLYLYTVEQSLKKISLNNIFTASIVFCIIILSHNMVALSFTPIFLIYSFLRTKKAFLHTIMSIFWGLALSAYFWIPSLLEAKYTSGLHYFKYMYKDHFPSVLQLIYSAWDFGPDVNLPGGLSPQIGIFSLLVFCISIYLIRKNIGNLKEIKTTLFWICIFIAGIFLSVSASSFIWETSDFLKKFQFPWRFITISSFAAAALSSYVFSKLKINKLIVILTLSIVMFSLQFIKVKEYVYKSDNYYASYKGSTYFRNEATTIWTAGDPAKEAKEQFQIIEGKGKILKVKKTSNSHHIYIVAISDITLIDNTVYFPGWKAYVDGKETPIEFQDILHRGIIEIKIPEGKHVIDFRFTETKIRLLSDIVTLSGFFSLIMIIILKKYKMGNSKFLLFFREYLKHFRIV